MHEKEKICATKSRGHSVVKFSAQCLKDRCMQVWQIAALVQHLFKDGRRQAGRSKSRTHICQVKVAHTKGSTRLMLFNPASQSVPSWHSWNGVVLPYYRVSLASVCYPLLHGAPLAETPSPVERQRGNHRNINNHVSNAVQCSVPTKTLP